MFKNTKYEAKWLRLLGLAIFGCLLVNVLGIIWFFSYPLLKTHSQFMVLPSPLTHTYDLFDLGVVDANNDNNLDIFTLNHSARQDFLLSDGNGHYRDALTEWKLDQDNQFPGLEDSDVAPRFDAPGLYIYRQNFLLHLYAHQINSGSLISGKFSLSLPITIDSQKGAEVDVRETPLPSGATATTVNFFLKDKAHLVIRDFPEIPHAFEIEEDTPLSFLHVGMQKLQPEKHDFTLMWRDRHSMAWSNVDNDEKKDVFIGRGGVQGRISQLPETLNDELFIQKNQVFINQAAQFEIIKNDCPGRKSSWIDFDGDNRLDLYLSCGRSSEDTVPYPNQLYRRQTDNSFVNVAEVVGLDLPSAGYFHWLDVDSDQDQDLIIAQEKQIFVYRNQEDHFEPQLIQTPSGGKLIKLTVSDFDQDGDFDAYSVMDGSKNQILVNQDGTFVFKDAAAYGLPEDGVDANWVDYDNDARLDLHVIPNGLYRQEDDLTFTETHLLDLRRPFSSIWNARSIWFDMDNDGDRDLLMAYQQTPSVLQATPTLWERIKNQVLRRDTSRIWQAVWYQNRGGKNHWIQLNLKGASGNAEAIGALVSVETNNNVQVQQIGITEGSHYSQGDHRAYFGVEDNSKIKRILIQWPDGDQQELNQVPVDQQLNIEKA